MLRKYLNHPLGYAISVGFGFALGALAGGMINPLLQLALMVGLMLMLFGAIALMGEE